MIENSHWGEYYIRHINICWKSFTSRILQNSCTFIETKYPKFIWFLTNKNNAQIYKASCFLRLANNGKENVFASLTKYLKTDTEDKYMVIVKKISAKEK